MDEYDFRFKYTNNRRTVYEFIKLFYIYNDYNPKFYNILFIERNTYILSGSLNKDKKEFRFHSISRSRNLYILTVYYLFCQTVL